MVCARVCVCGVCACVCGVVWCVCVCVCVASNTLLDNPLYVFVGEVADRSRRIDCRLFIGIVGSIYTSVFMMHLYQWYTTDHLCKVLGTPKCALPDDVPFIWFSDLSDDDSLESKHVAT